MVKRLRSGLMIKLLFRVSGEPGVEPLLVEAPDRWVNEYTGDFELVGEDTYVVVSDEGFWAYQYARDVLKRPWPEMEEVIKGGEWAWYYARNVLGLNKHEARRRVGG